jgi:hypothetical protein
MPTIYTTFPPKIPNIKMRLSHPKPNASFLSPQTPRARYVESPSNPKNRAQLLACVTLYNQIPRTGTNTELQPIPDVSYIYIEVFLLTPRIEQSYVEI